MDGLRSRARFPHTKGVRRCLFKSFMVANSLVADSEGLAAVHIGRDDWFRVKLTKNQLLLVITVIN